METPIGENRLSSALRTGRYWAMRDIRTDLRDRLASVMGRTVDEHDRHMRAQDALDIQHKMEIAALERERKALEALLAIEQERDGVLPLDRPAARPILPLGEFLKTKVHAHGPMDKDELRSEADIAGYFDDATNGRTFHTTLMNFVKHGKITQLPDGRYAYPERAPHAELFADHGDNGRATTQ
jgi:hypothetical protein